MPGWPNNLFPTRFAHKIQG